MSGLVFKNISKRDLELLRSGGVGILPTDTIYGIVTQVKNHDSVARLYAIKNRENKPGTIIAANIQQVFDIGVEPVYVDRAKKYWPGPVSVVMPVDESLKYIHQGKNSLAFRVVLNSEISKLLELTGPLLTSSANMPGEPVANNIDEAMSIFGDKVDFYVDGGNLSGRQSSSVVLLGDDGDIVLRQ